MFRHTCALILAASLLCSSGQAAHADAVEDCSQWIAREKAVAVAGCSQVIQQDPRAAWAYVNRARIYWGAVFNEDYEAGGVDRAIADLNKAIELDPSNPDAFRDRASAFEFKKDYDRAIRDLTRVVELDPDKETACRFLGMAYGYAEPESRSFWDEDPKTAEFCKAEKPVKAEPVETPAVTEPQVERKIDWPSHITYWSIELAQLFLMGATFGLIVGLFRYRSRSAVRLAVVYGAATLFAAVILYFEHLLGLELGSFWWFRENYLIEPLMSLVSALGFVDLHMTLFGPSASDVEIESYVASRSVAELIALIPLAAATLLATNYLDFAQRGGASTFSSGNPHRALAFAFPVTVLLGTGIAVAGHTFAPRDYMDQLGWQGVVALTLGIGLAVSVPVMAWRRSATQISFALVALVLAAAGIAGVRHSTNTRDALALAWSATSLLAAFFIYREWRRVWGAERAGLLRAAVGAFSWPFTRRKVMAERAGLLDDEALVAALQLPDHTLRAKEVVSSELAKRGLKHQAVPDWLPVPSRATLPPAIRRNIRPGRYRRFMRNRRRMQTVIRSTAIVGLVTVVGLLVVIPLVTLMSLVGGIAGRKRTARVLLLRPFGQARMTRALKRVVRRHVGLLGHTYTLSDQNYRPNFVLAALNRVFDWVLTVLGPLLRPSLRVTSVKDERTFLILSDFLLRTATPSFQGLLCSDQAFNIRTTDQWWKRCIDLLMWSSDLIVMDISRVSTGSAWEVTELARRGLLERCVFIAQAGYQAEGLASIAPLLPRDVQPHVYVFDGSGNFAEASELDRVLESRILEAAAHWAEKRREHAAGVAPVASGLAALDHMSSGAK